MRAAQRALVGVLTTAAMIVLSFLCTSTVKRYTILERVRRRHLKQKYTLTAWKGAISAASPPHKHLLLTRAAVLKRIPRGELAFFTLANAAYADLAINWALLLQPVLDRMNAAEHFFIGALDQNTLTQNGVPSAIGKLVEVVMLVR